MIDSKKSFYIQLRVGLEDPIESFLGVFLVASHRAITDSVLNNQNIHPVVSNILFWIVLKVQMILVVLVA
jgi:hypothetical protein